MGNWKRKGTGEREKEGEPCMKISKDRNSKKER